MRQQHRTRRAAKPPAPKPPRNMVIAGFQPLSLIDYPGKSCSIVFTQGCPFRCPYCHNPELIPLRPQTSIAEESVIRYLREHKKMLDGVCITGGEPTIQVGLRRFIELVKELGLLVKLDTNGIHPEFVRELFANRLVDYVAMDLKHRWDKYQDVVRSGGSNTVENCRKTFALIQESSVDHEFRTTICPGVHTKNDFHIMAGYLREGEQYFIQQTQFKKILDELIRNEETLRAQELVDTLRASFPKLIIHAR